MYDQERRDALKPLRVQNEITSAKIGKKKGNLQVVSKRFKTRVMRMQDGQSITNASRTRTVWLVAQSNVAVKNMAEKLADVDFWDFRILVSKDFHYDWHEHLYHQIEERLIRSDMFPETTIAASRMVLGARVMLCTLSCLSVDRIQSITKVVPLQTVLVDEASQIEVGDFVPMIHQYRETLQKIVFIGDDKQHRMPIQLGSFISKNVYKGKLKSQHLIRTPCISFINVVHGQEKSVGTSWTNEREVTTIVALARKYMQEGKNFRVITPYDPQRGAIEAALKHADLKWEDTVFNVDSFQGNECDHIIVSLVRSGHKLGFLALQRRVNVMLTRCKKSMTIVTKRAFIEGAGASSLAGKLAAACGSGSWSDA
ncbi:uncharacterized protein SCHCODRAFT_02502284 [Schizophyllum commune H4-8]|uniref:uncharacterized protein n=1 Tax=Schizophyllum commune (strain H4-8 / FGSC 9210) TaxID=578458 RepID=UPI00215E8C42|nr:uncharacterized protein SCHCODRAFT_02502284 [Schizophyllum commune H4-8]KAI5892948.1 hypothetical protein SCHCODRAFT_02502284 [Schizophyllum commune H4-8]